MVPLGLSSSPSSFLLLSQLLSKTLTLISSPPRRLFFKTRHHPPRLSYSRPLRLSSTSGGAAASSLFPSKDLVEPDWSSLESDSVNSDQEWADKAPRIISAGQIHEGSRVLTALPTIGFADLLADHSPCEFLLAIHESLFVLAMIKESHDRVRCGQGEISAVPEKILALRCRVCVLLSRFGAASEREQRRRRAGVEGSRGLREERRSPAFHPSLPDNAVADRRAASHGR